MGHSHGGPASIIKKIVIVLLALISLVGIIVFAVWKNEIITLMSVSTQSVSDDSHDDGFIYTMSVAGDYYFDEYLEQGGAKTDAELLAYVTSHITKGLISMEIAESDIGCSSFTATTKEGDRIFARNYDFSKTNTCIVYTNPGEGRHASYSTVDLQFIGVDEENGMSDLMSKVSALAAPYAPLDGINDAGVSVGIYMTYQGTEENEKGQRISISTDQNTDKPDITSTTMLRMILDYADDVDEAIEMVSKYDFHDSANSSFHYMIADANGKSAILEWVAGNSDTDDDGSARKLLITYCDDDSTIGEAEGKAKDYQWVTNFIVGDPNYYTDEKLKGGLDRYEILSEELTQRGGIVKDENEAMELLSMCGQRGLHPETDTVTVHSAIYNLDKKTVMWIGNEHYGKEDRILRFGL